MLHGGSSSAKIMVLWARPGTIIDKRSKVQRTASKLGNDQDLRGCWASVQPYTGVAGSESSFKELSESVQPLREMDAQLCYVADQAMGLGNWQSPSPVTKLCCGPGAPSNALGVTMLLKIPDTCHGIKLSASPCCCTRGI
jgi:hypothetical protein